MFGKIVTTWYLILDSITNIMSKEKPAEGRLFKL
jgi:hypothetical protein